MFVHVPQFALDRIARDLGWSLDRILSIFHGRGGAKARDTVARAAERVGVGMPLVIPPAGKGNQ